MTNIPRTQVLPNASNRDAPDNPDIVPARTLAIVLPALNEEEAIASVLEETLAAFGDLSREGVATEIIVVDDGSTDGTAEIVRRFDQVKLIQHERNRGYGAAITTGFEETKAEYLAFMDADGTCSPGKFRGLLRTIRHLPSAVVLGNRLASDSQMPTIRKIGNACFSILLSFLTGRSVGDTTSGMRIVTRKAWEMMRPPFDRFRFLSLHKCQICHRPPNHIG